MLAHDEIQRRALRAAAKVALTLSTASVFGACGSQTTATPVPPKDDAGDVDASTDTVVVDTYKVPDAVIDATACGPITPDAATTTQLECCAAKVKATFDSDAGEPFDAGGDADGGSPDPTMQACCGEIIKVYDATHDLGLSFQQARACCYMLPGVWYEHAGYACTPWGPPMPPAMPDEVVS